ncbi:preprotein translocase subunit YajC [Flexistipes sinusarabici]|uniref:preprotein translocase subunit YajC n=1 Tax=Flexistipes sinusarabici TaxID=2352 RepID=UPI002357EABE|nr:preprotein translocase subunit YajC [Flexistipes sinusarabici]
MFESIAYAAGQPAGGNPIWAFLPLILIFVIFYFLLIRPQQKRQKKHQEMIASLQAGDEIVTSGGIYGKIDKVLDDKTFLVEIANGVKITLSRTAVATKTDQDNGGKEEK